MLFWEELALNRRNFLRIAGAGTLGVAMNPLLSAREQKLDYKGIRAIAFDGFVIFDPRSVVKRAEEVLPGKGAEFVNLWRNRQFEYCWLRTAGQRYADFWQLTGDALRYAATSMKLSITGDQQKALMNAYLEMPAWPDVPEALAEFKKRGIRLRFLSNLTAAMLDANLRATKLREFFEDHLTTDLVRYYKPSPKAYQMGIDHFGLKKEEIAFAAFGAWDAAGAKWFGYPTVWVNRANVPLEELDAQPDVITKDIGGLVKFVE